MLEREIVKRIKLELRRRGLWVVKLHGHPMMPPGLPDILAIDNGRAIWFEVKRPGLGRVSKIQEVVMSELREHGCSVFVETSVADIDRCLVIARMSKPENDTHRRHIDIGLADVPTQATRQLSRYFERDSE